MSSQAWRGDVFAALKKGGVRQISFVPDAGHSHAIESAIADPEINDVLLTTEEEGVALAAGAWLGGQRAALLMQSSGVGNCVNMFSLLTSCQLPFLAIVTMRGDYAEFNPWQSPMGRSAQAALELMDIRVYRVDRSDEVAEIITAAVDTAFLAGERAAVLIGQRLIGRKKWK
jgi:sulfopyruvate decarboxylase alpha subunit